MRYAAGIILGHFYSGFSLTSRNKKRLDQGIALWAGHKVEYLISTGGAGMFYKNSPPASVLAKKYLVQHGVDEDRIFTDEHSTTTIENATYSLKIMREHQLQSAVIITSADHMTRALKVFREAYPQDIILVSDVADLYGGVWTFFDFGWTLAGNVKRYFRR